MFILPDAYVGSSCVIKTKNNDLLSMGTLQRIHDTYLDIAGNRNDLPELAYNLLVKIEIYNSREGFRVLLGNVYLSSARLARIININEATGNEHREYFRINVRGDADVYLEPQGQEEPEHLTVDLVDISLGGVQFRSSRELEIEQRFSILVPDILETEIYIATVCRRVEYSRGNPGFGCEFLNMTEKQENLLYKYILKNQNEQLKRVR